MADISIGDKIARAAEALITNNGVTEFWVGGYGDFDKYSSNAIHRLKYKYPSIKLVYVSPYLSKIQGQYKSHLEEKYDEIIISNVPENTPMKYRIIKTNEFMVDNSDYLICYIQFGYGGAFRRFEYAKKRNHIVIINLCDENFI